MTLGSFAIIKTNYMIQVLRELAITFLFCFFFIAPMKAQELPLISEKTKNTERRDGFFPFYLNEQKGQLWLVIDNFGAEFLYVNSLTAAVGSNDIGLDRNKLGETRVVYFSRRGNKVFLVQPNLKYRATSENKDEKESVDEAFPKSILWGFEIEAEENGSVLVDATEFLLRDAQNIGHQLGSNKTDSKYKVDESRSALYTERIKNFPDNSEFESILTFVGKGARESVRTAAVSEEAITVRQHHSFVKLPDDNFEMRKFDPRAGINAISYTDFSSQVGESLIKRFIVKHRLKKGSQSEVGEPEDPIIYYVDRGIPEPIRTAVIEGAEWWNEAFEAAGYKNAFVVKILPEGVDPMDIRYNIINWVHRINRGWAYGESVIDPRTGEIIKADVHLGSQRIRQDYLIAEGILAPYGEETDASGDDIMLEMSLNRIRLLSAHEVGHTLGLAHNFMASTKDDSSVMDYPAPKVEISADGKLSISKAYTQGIGEWDKRAITYAYKDLTYVDNKKKVLEDMVDANIEDGFVFISDRDSRPIYGAHRFSHLWDNGNDVIKELQHVMKVREIAMETFSEKNIRIGEPMATLEERFVPIYLFHRYQTEAVAKLIGGYNYSYKLRGDTFENPRAVEASQQQEALDVILSTVDPKFLLIPRRISDLISPRPLNYNEERELFEKYTEPIFDPMAAAESAANHTMKMLFDPKRAARLVNSKTEDAENLGFLETIDIILKRTWYKMPEDNTLAEIQRRVNYVTLYHLISLAKDDEASVQVKALTDEKLRDLKKNLEKKKAKNIQWKASYNYGIKLIRQHFDHSTNNNLRIPNEVPPGSPIGDEGF